MSSEEPLKFCVDCKYYKNRIGGECFHPVNVVYPEVDIVTGVVRPYAKESIQMMRSLESSPCGKEGKLYVPYNDGKSPGWFENIVNWLSGFMPK
jgi:hypothetical protein